MATAKQIAILYPGDMGAAIGRELRAAGHHVRTDVSDRSQQTRDTAQTEGFQLAETLTAALDRVDLIISLVPPGEAVNTARRVSETLQAAPASTQPPVYLDLNSISPATMRDIAGIVSSAGARCIDGTIHGQAQRLRQKSVLLLSGPGADDLRALFDGFMPVRTLGDEVGVASSLKMCLGAFTKGLVALSAEILVAAGSTGRHKEFVACMADFYPETTQLIARLLPSFPKHVARRIQEIGEAEAWYDEIGVTATMARGTLDVLEKIHAANLDPDRPWQFEELLDRLVQGNAFRKPPD